MYNYIKEYTNNAKIVASNIEKRINKNNEDLLSSNPHTCIYKIINTIEEFNKM